MKQSANKEKEQIRKELDKQISKFLRGGGKIEEVRNRFLEVEDRKRASFNGDFS